VVGKVSPAEAPGMNVDEAASGSISMWIADMAPFTGKASMQVQSTKRRAVRNNN
jgi:hypothetical protein